VLLLFGHKHFKLAQFEPLNYQPYFKLLLATMLQYVGHAR